MSETTSALIRFADLMEKIHQYKETDLLPEVGYDHTIFRLGSPHAPGHFTSVQLGNALCGILGQEIPGRTDDGYDVLSQQRAYLLLAELAEQAQYFVFHNSGQRSRTVNLATLRRVTQYIEHYHIQSPIRAFQAPLLPIEAVENLHALAENISARNDERAVTQEEKEALLSSIRDLLFDLSKLSVPDALNNRMFRLLEELQGVVLRLGIVSPDELVKRLDEFTGLAVKAVAVSKGEGEEAEQAAQTLFQKTVALMGQAAQVVEHVKTIGPALGWLAQNIPGLPWSK